MKLCLLPAIVLLSLTLRSSVAHAQTPENLQIYILMGQSNMLGLDSSTLASQVDNPHILALNGDGQWIVAREPMSGMGGIGPGIPFAQEILKANPDVTIGLVPCAVGSTALYHWVKDAKCYEDAVRRAKAAAPSGTIRGVLWHQGESDSLRLEYAQTYETRLAQMFQDLRRELESPHLPIVVGQLGDFLSPTAYPHVELVRSALAHIPSALPRVGFASSAGLVDKGDKVHFTAAAQQEFGPRYAQEMLRLQSQPVLDDRRLTFALGQNIVGAQLWGRDSEGETLAYYVSAGTLPEGVELNSDGSFSGTPTALTAATGVQVTVTVEDGSGGLGSGCITIRVQDSGLIVTTTEDSVPDSATDPDDKISLREAITYANAHPGADTILFDADLFGQQQAIAIETALPDLSEDVSFLGPGAQLLTVKSKAPEITEAPCDLFHINQGVSVSFTGLTLAHGQSGFVNSGTVTLTDCALSGHSTALENHGIATLTSCTLNGNSEGIVNLGTLNATNCTLSDNTIVGISNSGIATVANCTMSRNATGIINSTGTDDAESNAAPLTLQNSLVVGNSESNVIGDFSDGGHNLTTGTATEAGLDPNGLQANGGPTATIALVVPNGQAVNAGDNSLLWDGLTTDQRGSGYDRIRGGTVDIGAFESKWRANSAPTDITLSKNTIPENSGPNGGVGTLYGIDPDAEETFTFSLPAGVEDNDLFVLTLGIQLRAKASFDYATRNSYWVTVRVTDSGGLSFDKQFAIRVTETLKPTISISSPGANQRLFIQNFVRNSIRGVAVDNVGIGSIKIRLSRKRGTANAYWNGIDFVPAQTYLTGAMASTTINPTTGYSEVNWYLSGQMPSMNKLDAGVYQIRVYAKDTAGNQSEYLDRSFTLKSDTVAPTITLATPTVNQKLLISSFLENASSGTASDAEGVVGVKVRLSRKNGTTNVHWNGTDFTSATALVDADLTGTTSATWKFKSLVPPADKLTAGVYSLAVYATDEAGNKSETLSVTFNLSTDYTPPSVSVATPTTNQILDLNTLTVGSFAGSADDNLGVTSVKLKLQRKRGTTTTYWNGTEFTTAVATIEANLISTTGTSVTWQLAQPIPASKLDRGGYTLYAQVLDAAGNNSTSAGRVFSLTGTANMTLGDSEISIPSASSTSAGRS